MKESTVNATISNAVEIETQPMLQSTIASKILYQQQVQKFQGRKTLVKVLISVTSTLGLAFAILTALAGQNLNSFVNIELLELPTGLLQVIILILVIVVYEIERNTSYILKIVVANQISHACSDLEVQIRQNIVLFKSQASTDSANLDQLINTKINDWKSALDSIISITSQSDVGIHPSQSEKEQANNQATIELEKSISDS